MQTGLTAVLNSRDHSDWDAAYKMDRAQRFMATAMLGSALVHGVLIGGVRFTMPTPKRSQAAEPIEIVLVNQRTETAPQKHDVLAQTNLDGGGNSDVKVRAKSPLPAIRHDPVLERAVAQQKQFEEKAARLMTRLKAEHAFGSPEKDSPPQAQDAKGFDAESLKQQAREIGAMAAQISREYNAYQERPRKTFVGARARQSSVAMWMDAWMQKIERVGTHAYPVDAYGNKLRGKLRVLVEINNDGSILQALVDKSSGNKELDEAALRILRQAAPFSKLPADMVDDSGKPATVLSFARTWMFGRSDTLGLDN